MAGTVFHLGMSNVAREARIRIPHDDLPKFLFHHLIGYN